MLIAFFNKYVDSEELSKEFKFGSKILNKIPCFTYDLELYKTAKEIVPFYSDDFKKHKQYNISFGMLYELDINKDDLFLLDMILNMNYKLKSINVTPIFIESYSKFKNNEFQIADKNVKCLSYTAIVNERNVNIFKNRHIKINFNSKLLIDYVKI